MKHCNCCKWWLPRTDFQRDRSTRDGLAGKCRLCTRIRGIERRKGATRPYPPIMIEVRDNSVLGKLGR